MASKKKLNVAVIGCGVIAPTHIESYQMLKGVKVSWLCDLEAEKAAKLATKYGVERTSTKYEEVFSDPSLDCVSVCTDHASHTPIVLAALKAGKHVLCEKALASSFDNLSKMLAAGKKHSDLVFGGVFQHRFDGVYPYVKHLIEDGALGQILTANVHIECLRTDAYYKADKWRGTWEEEGGSVLINQGIHFIDTISWLMGGVESLSGTYANLTHKGVIETEDTATASLRFKSGALGTIAATSSSHLGWETTLTFYGTDGTISIRTGKPLRVLCKNLRLGGKIEKDLKKIEETPSKLGKAYYGPSHPALIADFVKASRGEKPYFIPAEEAAEAVKIVLSIYESHKLGRAIKIK